MLNSKSGMSGLLIYYSQNKIYFNKCDPFTQHIFEHRLSVFIFGIFSRFRNILPYILILCPCTYYNIFKASIKIWYNFNGRGSQTQKVILISNKFTASLFNINGAQYYRNNIQQCVNFYLVVKRQKSNNKFVFTK